MRQGNRFGTRDKKSFNLQLYADVRQIAFIARYLIKQGQLVSRSYGELLQTCVDIASYSIEHREGGSRTDFEFIGDAIDYLEGEGFAVSQIRPRDGSAGWNKRLYYDLGKESVERDFDRPVQDTVYKKDLPGEKKVFGNMTQAELEMELRKAIRQQNEQPMGFAERMKLKRATEGENCDEPSVDQLNAEFAQRERAELDRLNEALMNPPTSEAENE